MDSFHSLPKTEAVEGPPLPVRPSDRPRLAPQLSWEESAYFILRRGRDRMLSPLASLLALLGVRPAAVSALGVLLAASTCLSLPEHRGLALAGFLGALLCDALDGALARRLASSSPLGKLIDQLADTLTFSFLMAALGSSALVPAGAALFAVLSVAVLLALGIRHHSAQRPGPRIHPRGGFFAHCPKAVVYAALALFLLGGADWLAPATYLANGLAVLFTAGFLWTHGMRVGAAGEGLPVARG